MLVVIGNLILLVSSLAIVLWATAQAPAHEWFDWACCSDRDCHVVPDTSVRPMADGWHIDGNAEVVPYTSNKLRMTPPEGEGRFAVCTRGGKPEAPVICLYVPGMGT